MGQPVYFQVPLIQRVPTKIVASGTLTLNGANPTQFFGSNTRRDRIQFVVTNLSNAVLIQVQTVNGVPWMTVFPQRVITIESGDDFQLCDPTGAGGVQFQVGELYPDTGNLHGVTPVNPGAVPPGPAGGAGAGAGAGAGGGGYSGGSSGGRGTNTP